MNQFSNRVLFTPETELKCLFGKFLPRRVTEISALGNRETAGVRAIPASNVKIFSRSYEKVVGDAQRYRTSTGVILRGLKPLVLSNFCISCNQLKATLHRSFLHLNGKSKQTIAFFLKILSSTLLKISVH